MKVEEAQTPAMIVLLKLSQSFDRKESSLFFSSIWTGKDPQWLSTKSLFQRVGTITIF